MGAAGLGVRPCVSRPARAVPSVGTARAASALTVPSLAGSGWAVLRPRAPEREEARSRLPQFGLLVLGGVCAISQTGGAGEGERDSGRCYRGKEGENCKYDR